MKTFPNGSDAPSVLPEYEIARRYGINPTTWRRMMKSGETPPPVKLTPHRRGYIVAETDAWWNDRLTNRENA